PVRSGTWGWLAAAAAAGALASGAAVWMFRPPPAPVAPAMRFHVSAPEDFRFGRLALSPDGRNVAFTATSEGSFSLWVHSFDTGQSRRLDRAGVVQAPMFWSPDATSIGFVADGAIRRIAVDGTAPQSITAAEDFLGGQWMRDGTALGTILY